MKLIIAVLAAVFSLVWLMPEEAAAQKRTYRGKYVKKQTQSRQVRTASVGQNGLCQRDTGTPVDKLDFRNKCDTEEFWRRIMDRGSAGER